MPGLTSIVRLRASLTLISIAFGLFGLLGSSLAQDGTFGLFGYDDHPIEQIKPRKVRREIRATHMRLPENSPHDTFDKKEGGSEAIVPTGAIYAIVSIADQRVTVYDATGRIAQSRVSTGMPGHPTPIGLFTIIGKDRWHRSNIYSGAPMPFMQRITWSGVAMHLGVVPGYPASHGCVRLPGKFAQEFWGMTQIGSRIVIAKQGADPIQISNTNLPVPKLYNLLASPLSQQSSLAFSDPVQVASLSGEAPMIAAATQGEHLGGMTTAHLLNPVEYALALKERARARKVAAERAVHDAYPASHAMRRSAIGLNLISSTTAIFAGKSVAAFSLKIFGRSAPGLPIGSAAGSFLAAQGFAIAKLQTLLSALQSWKDAVEAMRDAERRLKPVSVLFSKKEGRVFIRQDWKEIYDAPVTFKDPDRPIGTHLFVAVAADADSKLNWSAISVPSGSSIAEASSRRPTTNDHEPPPAVSASQGDSAASALERLNVPDEVRWRISELVWVGAEIIVTDRERSAEMDSDSDFIVSTR